MPLTGPTALLGAFAIAGAPPFGLFLSELTILSAAFSRGYWVVALVMLVAIGLIFMGLVKHFSRMAFGEAPEGLASGELGRWTIGPTLGLMALAASIGIYLPQPLVSALEQVVRVVRGLS
ncbi:hydrogenase 4 subunit F [compost metagenome]